MKKLLALLLALVMVLAACGGTTTDNTDTNTNTEQDATTPEGEGEDTTDADTQGEETAETDFSGKTLRFAGLDGGYGTKAWIDVINRFQELTGATVEAQFEKNIWDVVRPQIQDGAGPDVIYNSVGQEINS